MSLRTSIFYKAHPRSKWKVCHKVIGPIYHRMLKSKLSDFLNGTGKETDLDKIEAQVIAKTYDEVPNLTIDVEAEEIKLVDFIEQIKKEKQDEIMDT